MYIPADFFIVSCSFFQRVSHALGISLTTISRIRKQEREEDLQPKKRKVEKKKTEDLPDNTKMAVRHCLYKMISESKCKICNVSLK